MPKPGYFDGTEVPVAVDPSPATRAALVPGAAVDVRGVDGDTGLPGGWLAATITSVAVAAGVEGCLKFRVAVEGGGGDVPGWLPLAVPTAARPTPVLAVRPRHAPGAVDAYAVGDAVEAAHGSAWWPATVESVDGGASAAVVRLAPAAGGPPDPVLTLPPAQLRPAPAAGDPWGGGVAAPVGERVHPEEWAKRVGPPRPHLVQGFAVDAATLVSTFERAPGAGASGEGAAEALVRVASAV